MSPPNGSSGDASSIGEDEGGSTFGGPVFVGRGRELDQIGRGLDDALAGRGRSFLLMGEPGIGKTSLCDEVTTAAVGRGVLVSWGRSWEAGGAPAYWPWLDVLAAIARQLDDTALQAAVGDGGSLLGEIVPEIRARLPEVPAGAPPPADEARFRLWRTVVALVRRAAAPAGLVLIFDDLHSADRSSLLLLYALARELRSLRVLLLATCRDAEARIDPEASELIARIAREGVTLGLARLDRVASADLLRRRGGRLAPDIEARICDSTQGNPLFLVEMARLLDDEGPAAIAAGVVPVGVRDVIRQRLDRVSTDARSLLDLAAVAGDDVQADLLARAAARDGQQTGTRDGNWVAGRIADATQAGVFAMHGGRLRFSHALIREVLYRDLPPNTRRALHAAVGAAIERLHAADATPPLMELAHHAIEGPPGDIARAVGFAVRAAAQPSALTAPEESIALLERVVAALAAAGNPPALRAPVLLALAETRIRGGDAIAGRSLCCEVATLARTLDDPELLARAALTYGRVFTFAVVDPIMVDLLESALAALPTHDSPLRARLLARLAGALQPATHAEEPVRAAYEAIAIARRLGDRRALLETIHDGLSALMDVVDPRERRALNLEVEALAIAEGDRERLLRTHARLAIDYFALGELAEAGTRIDAFEALATELRASWILWRVPMFRALVATIQGRFAEAERLDDEARERARAVRDPQAERAFVLRREGLLRTADRHAEMRALDAHARRERGNFHNPTGWQAALSALLHARLEDAEQARLHLERAVSREEWPLDNLFAIFCLCEAVAFVGSASLAEQLYLRLLPCADQCMMLGMTQIQWEGPVTRLLGLLAEHLERWDDAVAHHEDAIARLRRLEAHPHVARARYELGRILVRRAAPGDRARARGEIAEARRAATELVMPGLVALADARLAGLEADGNATPVAVSPASPAKADVGAAAPAMSLEGEYWTVTTSGGRTFRLKDSLGLRYLARLFAEPGREIHVLDLAGGTGGGGAAAGGDEAAIDGGDAGELLDDEARAEYRQRLEDLRDTLTEAESFGDTTRAARAREEIDFLGAELGRAVGLGGRARRAGSASERARSAVQRRIKNAIARIADAAPELGPWLGRAVRTGNFCVFRPDAGG